MEVIPLLVPQRDYAVTLSAADLNALSPGEVGLVSLSEAELYIEVSDQLEVFEVESPKEIWAFRDIVRHFSFRASK